MKQMPSVIAVILVCSCASENSYKYNAYYNMDNSQLVIENSDEYTTRMIWHSNYAPFSIDVCLMPENREIHLEAIRVKD
jgi:hypothetical protein